MTIWANLTKTETEYVPLGTFWSRSWDAPQDDVWAYVVGWDRLEFLRRTRYSVSTPAQNINLKDLAEDVLIDAGLEASEYNIDPALASITVPWGWFDDQTHRECLRMIAEACVGQVYCDRLGVIQIMGPLTFLASDLDLAITSEHFERIKRPYRPGYAANSIKVNAHPLRTGALEELYRSEEITLAPGIGVYRVSFNTIPSINASASLENELYSSIVDQEFYSWGAIITVENIHASASDTFTLVLEGNPLTTPNKMPSIAQDLDMVQEDGEAWYIFPHNHLVQNSSMAQDLADSLLESYKQDRLDVELDWRGNPALELGDVVELPDFEDITTDKFEVVRQSLKYDGSLEAYLLGRRIIIGP